MTPPCASAQRLAALPERTFDPAAVPPPNPWRTTPPPPEVMAVAETVLGWQRHQLDGWQRVEAMCAMNALGDSMGHIATELGVTPSTVEKHVRRHGGKPSVYDRRVDWYGIHFVALLGGRIRLEGIDRDEAVRLLARRGLTNAQIAQRLMVDNPETIARDAERKEIEVVHANAWPSEVLEFRRRQRETIATEELIAA